MGVTAADVSAVLVTRGDVDVDPILQSWLHAGIQDAVVWDNSQTTDLAVYGRYAAIEHARQPVILVQDDDAILPPESIAALVAGYQPGVVTANMPARFRHGFYRDHCLVGFGAIFDRTLPQHAFNRFLARYYPQFEQPGLEVTDDQVWWRRTCDIVFTALTERVLVDLPYEDRPFSSAAGRMWMTAGHVDERKRMLDLALAAR